MTQDRMQLSELLEKARTYMERISAMPDRVRSHFKN